MNAADGKRTADHYELLEAVVTEHREGCLLKVKVHPRASRDALEGTLDGALKIALTTPPVEGKANKRLLEFLASLLHTRRRHLELTGGRKSRLKQVLVRGLSKEEVIRRLENALG